MEGYDEYQAEELHEWQNQQMRKENSSWEDYIIVDWNNGDSIERQDEEKNLVVYY